jgi:hypothetical protein
MTTSMRWRPPAPPAQRRRQQASQARFDHAVGLVEQAAKAASISDQQALDAAVARMEQVALDDFEQRHPPAPPWTTCCTTWSAT